MHLCYYDYILKLLANIHIVNICTYINVLFYIEIINSSNANFINIGGKYLNMAKLTIKEIAKMAGVSPTAVSFVINNREGVSEETRKRVKEVIERTNFQPSLNSRRLLLNKSFNISIVIRKTSSPFDDLFYLEIAKGLLEKSKEYGYNIVFTDIAMEDGKVVLPDIIKHEDTDGIVFFQDTEEIILNEVNKLNIPYVMLMRNMVMEQQWNNTVNANYELSAYTCLLPD